MKRMVWIWLGSLGLATGKLLAETPQEVSPSDPTNPSGRLTIPATRQESSEEIPFEKLRLIRLLLVSV